MIFTLFKKPRLKKTLLVLLITQMFVFAACRPTPPVNSQDPLEEKQALEEQVDPTGLDLNLIKAAEQGDLEAVINLLDQGTGLNVTDSRGITPLIAASYQNHVEVAQELIDRGADVNLKDNSQQNAFLIATSEGYLELLQITLSAGADVSSFDSFNGTGLIRAAERGHVDIVTELLKTEINLDHVNRLGWTALLEAIILGRGSLQHTNVVRLLVEAGADINIGDNNGVLPIEHARRLGFTDIVVILEQNGPSLFSTPSPPVTLPSLPATPLENDLPSALTQHPLYPYTLFGLRARAYPGGEIVLQSVLEQSDAFTRYYINYPSDDLTITGILHLPVGPGPFPVLILLHGYIERDLYFSGADTWQAAEFFARQGYLVLAPDLRSWGASDPGLSLFHTGLVIDVLNLINAIPTLPQADATKIGLWGHSMGGGIVTKVLTIESRIRAAVLYAPNSADDADLLTRWGAGCLPGQSEAAGDHCNPAEIIPANTSAEIIEAYLIAAKDPEFLKAVAPIFHLESISAPIQLHIGDNDGQFLSETPPAWSFKVVEALETHNKDIDFYIYPGQGHSFLGDSWISFLQRSLTFFNQNLQSPP
jgi:hypothetical protein